MRDQYRLIRTPAYLYFPSREYQLLHSAIVQWGRENLGCHDISPPWLSYYVQGCRQNLHSDVPHGPWAFVFSLSPKKIQYEGGETMILKPNTLNYWGSFTSEKNHEVEEYIDYVPAKFNRLTVFDPRFPHGVSEVRGVEDPLQARLVIHGWFVEPRPYVVGGLTTSQVQKVLGHTMEEFSDDLQDLGRFHGTMSVRLHIQKTGEIQRTSILTDTVFGLDHHSVQRPLLNRLFKKHFMQMAFPTRAKSSQITVPILFKG